MSRHSGQKIEINKKTKSKNNFQPMKKQGHDKQKKVKVYYIGVQNFVRPPGTSRTQQIC